MVNLKGRSIILLCLSLTLFILFGKLMAADRASPQDINKTTAPKAEYLSSPVCIGCHQELHATFSETMMGKIFLNAPRTQQEARGCEACHGPGLNHLDALGTGKEDKGIINFRSNSPKLISEHNAICLSCHESGLLMHWHGSQHESADLPCTSCHTVMKKISPKMQFSKETEMETCFQCHTDKRAKLHRFSRHPIKEGKVFCSDCHNPHGGPGSNLVKNTVNETCYQCHAEKRGPFLWEHHPVRDNCLNCHDPHGTTQPKMLVQRVPFLCQNCHTSLGLGFHGAVIREGGDLAIPAHQRIAGKACLNCHSRIHGSNHPSGARFTR